MAKSSIRISAKTINNETLVKALMKHEMESGNRTDKTTGNKIPAFFISQLTAESAGKVVFSADLSGGVSTNPYVSFKFNGNKGDMVKITWVDTKGATDSAEAKIK